MGNYLPLLLVLACPLMMVFMMRGMSGGHGTGSKDNGPHDEQAPQVDQPTDRRIVDLERQVAELRAERDRAESAARRR